MIKQMIHLDPSSRPTFDTLLHTARGPGHVFPESFYSFLHNYVSSVNDLPSPSPFSPSSNQTPNNPTSTGIGTTGAHSVVPSTSSASTVKPGTTTSNTTSGGGEAALPSDSDQRIDRIWADYESVEPYLVADSDSESARPETGVKVDYGYGNGSPGKAFQDILPVELHIPNRDSELRAGAAGGQRAATEGEPVKCHRSCDQLVYTHLCRRPCTNHSILG